MEDRKDVSLVPRLTDALREALSELVTAEDACRAAVAEDDSPEGYAKRAPLYDRMERARYKLAEVGSDYARAALAQTEPPEGWKYVLVNKGFDVLMDAPARAYNKGYMPAVIIDHYESFDWRVAQTEPSMSALGESPLGVDSSGASAAAVQRPDGNIEEKEG